MLRHRPIRGQPRRPASTVDAPTELLSPSEAGAIAEPPPDNGYPDPRLSDPRLADPVFIEQPPEPPLALDPPPVRSLWPWLLLLLALVLGGLGAAYALTRDTGRARSSPPVKSVVSRAATLPAPAPTPVAHAGAVRAQARRAAGSPVARVGVPNVLGIRAPLAIKHLAAAGLRSRVVGVASGKPAGVVVRATPDAGARVVRGAVVAVAVSRGPARSVPASAGSEQHAPAPRVPEATTAASSAPTVAAAQVPDVVGLRLAAARKRLRGAGLRASVVHVPSSQPAGTVVAQAPKAEAAVRAGASVQVNVANGPARQSSTAIPDVTGEDEATATSDLEQAGFTVDTTDQPTDDPGQDGTVVDEQPAAGTAAPPGTHVTLTIGVYTDTTAAATTATDTTGP